jgi:hypothetical protein
MSAAVDALALGDERPENWPERAWEILYARSSSAP